MGISRRFAAALIVGVASVSEAQSRPCPRPAPRNVAPGATVVVTAAQRPPCRLQIVDTPIELRADARGDIGGFDQRVHRGPDGKFYTKYASEISVWTADGRHLRNFGRQGSGPGEFIGVGWPHLYLDRQNRIYALDRARWSLFSPTLELIRTVIAASPLDNSYVVPGPRYDTDVSELLDDGTFLGADPSLQRSGVYFHIWDIGQISGRKPMSSQPGGGQLPSEMPLLQMFDRVPTAEEGVAVGRAIGYGGGDTFWAGPPWGTTTRGWQLELWKTDGTRLMTVKRDVPWIPVSPQRPPTPRGATQEKPVPMVIAILVDSSGLLYVAGSRATDKWRTNPPEGARPPGPPPPLPSIDEMYEYFADVVDPRAGVVLASIGPMSRSQLIRELPFEIFRGTRLGYRRGETAEGYPFVRIVEFRLVAQ